MASSPFVTLSVVLGLSLGGCSTINGSPPRMATLMQHDARLTPIRDAIKRDCFDLPVGGPNADPGTRNTLVLAYMLAVDEAYNDFELALGNEARTGNFVATIASLGLATGGSVAAESTARTLSAANSAVIGVRETFNKDYLFSQTIAALENQMRASRAAVRRRIYDSMTHGTDIWPTCLALQDLTAYEQAGTLTGALVGLNETTASSKVINEAQAQQAAERLKFDNGTLATALRAYFSPDDDQVMQARLANAKGPALAASKLTVPPGMSVDQYVGMILSGSKYGAEQHALALGIIATEPDPAARAPLVAALRN